MVSLPRHTKAEQRFLRFGGLGSCSFFFCCAKFVFLFMSFSFDINRHETCIDLVHSSRKKWCLIKGSSFLGLDNGSPQKKKIQRSKVAMPKKNLFLVLLPCSDATKTMPESYNASSNKSVFDCLPEGESENVKTEKFINRSRRFPAILTTFFFSAWAWVMCIYNLQNQYFSPVRAIVA